LNVSARLRPFLPSRVLLPLMRWEMLLLGLILLTVLLFSVPASPWYTPYFLNTATLLGMSGRVIAVGLMALPLTLIIIAGQIDLSVESMLALAAMILATRWSSGWNIWVAALFALGVGAVGGLFNGLIVTRIRLPSLVVTLGTYALFRGLAFVILGDRAIDFSNAPTAFVNIGQGSIGGTPIPEYLVLFVVLAIIFGLVLHRTSFGRYLYAIGSNQETCRYSGVRVDVIITILFVATGIMSALAGIVETARLGSARADIDTGVLLDVVTAVVLGGVDIFGGSGTIVGPVLALVLIALLRGGLGLLQVSDDIGDLIVGALLILSILLPHLVQQAREYLVRRGRQVHYIP
jgi:rhamnose transport system permease protein